jgi:very-short-patch-repair endonuclease
VRDQKSLAHAKALRSEPTSAEARLWYRLRAHRFAGLKFRRQTVIGPYIADFTCRAAMLVIELDGDTHAEQALADELRTRFLGEKGWQVLRFANADVMMNIEAVLGQIADAVGVPPLPGPLP